MKYLHAIHAKPGSQPVLEGIVSGREFTLHYRLLEQNGVPVMQALYDDGSEEEIEKFIQNYARDVVRRVDEEKAAGNHHPRRLKGQFYLQRDRSGMPSSHAHCVAAVQLGELDLRFVSLLQGWKLELLYP